MLVVNSVSDYLATVRKLAIHRMRKQESKYFCTNYKKRKYVMHKETRGGGRSKLVFDYHWSTYKTLTLFNCWSKNKRKEIIRELKKT